MTLKFKLPQSTLTGPSWIFPETVSFLVRCCELMSIACITSIPSSAGYTEVSLILISALIFLLNCIDFSRPPNEIIFLYTLSAIFSAVSVILMAVEASVQQRYTIEKYYTTIFESLATSGNAIVMGYFYLYHHEGVKHRKLK